MKKIRKGVLVVWMGMLYQVSASTVVEGFSSHVNTGKTSLQITQMKDSLSFSHTDYFKKDPYTLEELSEKFLQDGDSITAAKLYIVAAIKGNKDTQEYFQNVFGKSPKDLIFLIKHPKSLTTFIKEVANRFVMEFEEDMEVLEQGSSVVFPSGKPVITTSVLKQ